MDFDTVKAERLCGRGALRISVDHGFGLGQRHPLADSLTWHDVAGRTDLATEILLDVRVDMFGLGAAREAGMPELRHDFSADGMNLVQHALPPGKRIFAVETRHLLLVGSC